MPVFACYPVKIVQTVIHGTAKLRYAKPCGIFNHAANKDKDRNALSEYEEGQRRPLLWKNGQQLRSDPEKTAMVER